MIHMRNMSYLLRDHLHDRLFEVHEVLVILGWCSRDDVVLVLVVAAEHSKLVRVRELDVDTPLLHDLLNALATDADDALVVDLRNMEGYLCRQLLLQHVQTA